MPDLVCCYLLPEVSRVGPVANLIKSLLIENPSCAGVLQTFNKELHYIIKVEDIHNR